MKMISSRMCVVTRQRQNKNDLIKITNDNGTWKLTNEDYLGRSIYLKKDKEIINKFLTKKIKCKNFVMNDKLKEELFEYAQYL